MFRNIFTFRHLFDFKGRASRREWLLLHAAWIAAFILPMLVGIALTGGANPDKATGASFVIVMISAAISGIMMWGGLVALLAVAFRRLHDQGNSAVFLLFGLIPLIGWVIMLIMMLYPGQRYANEYGPDPREPLQSVEENYEAIFN